MEEWGCLTFIIFLRRLVNNRTVLKAPEVKHAHAAIRTATDEHIDTVCAETHIVDFLIMSNQLRLGR